VLTFELKHQLKGAVMQDLQPCDKGLVQASRCQDVISLQETLRKSTTYSHVTCVTWAVTWAHVSRAIVLHIEGMRVLQEQRRRSCNACSASVVFMSSAT
jgi:hypothetical protein